MIMDKIRIKLDSNEKRQIAQWAQEQLDGYLENLQDDQNRCYRCGLEEDEHNLGKKFSDKPGPHGHWTLWPEPRTEIIHDGDEVYWVIQKFPEMIGQYLVDCILAEDYKNNIDLDDWRASFGSAKPSDSVAEGLRQQLFAVYPDLDIPYRRFEVKGPDGNHLDSRPGFRDWSLYDMDFNSQEEADVVMNMKIGDSFTEDDGVTTTRIGNAEH